MSIILNYLIFADDNLLLRKSANELGQLLNDWNGVQGFFFETEGQVLKTTKTTVSPLKRGPKTLTFWNGLRNWWMTAYADVIEGYFYTWMIFAFYVMFPFKITLKFISKIRVQPIWTDQNNAIDPEIPNEEFLLSLGPLLECELPKRLKSLSATIPNWAGTIMRLWER